MFCNQIVKHKLIPDTWTVNFLVYINGIDARKKHYKSKRTNTRAVSHGMALVNFVLWLWNWRWKGAVKWRFSRTQRELDATDAERNSYWHYSEQVYGTIWENIHSCIHVILIAIITARVLSHSYSRCAVYWVSAQHEGVFTEGGNISAEVNIT
jgi:hypothetical protein